MKRTLVVAAVLSLSLVPVTTAHGAFPGSNGKIVYSNGGDLFVMQSNGTGVTQITSGRGSDDSPVWSPDGTKIAFSRVVGRRDFLEVTNADGSGRAIITRARSGGMDGVAWSPGGTKIAFSAPGAKLGSLHIFTVHVDGTHLRDLTKHHGVQDDREPAWSPDGTKIAFAGVTKGGRTLIETMTARDGSSRTTVVHGENHVPDWSPDGTKIVFARPVDVGNGSAYFDIFIANSDGTGIKNLTHTPLRDEWGPVFSPDGTKILYSKSGSHHTDDLWTRNLDGTSPTRITNTAAINELDPDWQPI